MFRNGWFIFRKTVVHTVIRLTCISTSSSAFLVTVFTAVVNCSIRKQISGLFNVNDTFFPSLSASQPLVDLYLQPYRGL